MNSSWPMRAMIALAVIVSFGAGLAGNFVGWDDEDLITQNPHFNPPTVDGLVHHWRHADHQMYIPVVYTAWWTLAHVPGSGQALNPMAFHAANLVAHALSAIVVYEILLLLIGSRFAACAGALVFAVHPLQTESVAWATGMKDCLSGLLALLAIWQYLLARRANSPARYALASAIFVLALLAKPSTVAVPVICAVLDWLMLRGSPKVIARYLLPWIVAAAVFVWIASSVQPIPHSQLVPEPWDRGLIAADSLSWYLIKIVWPAGLTIDYSHTPDAVLNSSWMKYEALLIVAVLIALSIWRRREYLAAGLIFVAALLPISGLTPFAFQRYSTVADRYAYLAMLGIGLALAAALQNIAWKKWIAPFGIVVALLVVLSIRQALVWHDTLTLFTHAIQVNPNSLAANRSLGFYWAQNHDDARAAKYYTRAGVLYPDDPTNHYDYANLLLRHGAVDQAIEHYQQAVNLDSEKPAFFLNYGVALMAAHRPAEALEAFTRAADIDPNNVDAYQNAGLVLEQMGALDAARQAFSEALKRDPTRAIPRQHLQRLSATQRSS